MKTLNWEKTERNLAAGIYILVSEGGQIWEVNWDKNYLDKDIRKQYKFGPEWKVKKMVLSK